MKKRRYMATYFYTEKNVCFALLILFCFECKKKIFFTLLIFIETKFDHRAFVRPYDSAVVIQCKLRVDLTMVIHCELVIYFFANLYFRLKPPNLQLDLGATKAYKIKQYQFEIWLLYNIPPNSIIKLKAY